MATEEKQEPQDYKSIVSRPLIGILGGVGPMAGVALHTKIINNTKNVVVDQNHLEVMHLSCSRYVSDRTGYILQLQNDKDDKGAINPAIGCRPLLNAFSSAALAMNTTVVVGVCCNTFHAPLIYKEFKEQIKDINKRLVNDNDNNNNNNPGYIHSLHMIELTLDKIKSNRVGLLSTTGTRKTNLYRDIAKTKGIEIIEIDEDIQNELHETIYNKNDGIKVLNCASKRVRNLYEKYIKILKDKGCNAVILGCTEIPLVFQKKENELFGVELIDPVEVLANAMLQFVNDNTVYDKTGKIAEKYPVHLLREQ